MAGAFLLPCAGDASPNAGLPCHAGKCRKVVPKIILWPALTFGLSPYCSIHVFFGEECFYLAIAQRNSAVPAAHKGRESHAGGLPAQQTQLIKTGKEGDRAVAGVLLSEAQVESIVVAVWQESLISTGEGGREYFARTAGLEAAFGAASLPATQPTNQTHKP